MATVVDGSTLGARYVVKQRLGRGGMAVVYQAYDPRLDQDVALKVLAPQLSVDPTFVQRFRREGRTLAGLKHDHIVRLFDLVEEDQAQLYYLVLEFLTGGTLKRRLGGTPAEVADVVEVLAPVAAALDFAHRQRTPVIHRDLKPSNILFDGHGRVVVSDFGLARILTPEEPDRSADGERPRWYSLSGGQSVGTPQYMAPEQAEGRVASPATDLYALGVIAYEMLTGTVPFLADTPEATRIQVARDPLPLPRMLNPDIDEPVERVLLKALAREPVHRFPTACEMVDALSSAGRLTVVPTARTDRVGPMPIVEPEEGNADPPAIVVCQNTAADHEGTKDERQGVRARVGPPIKAPTAQSPEYHPPAPVTDGRSTSPSLSRVPDAELRRASDGPVPAIASPTRWRASATTLIVLAALAASVVLVMPFAPRLGDWLPWHPATPQPIDPTAASEALPPLPEGKVLFSETFTYESTGQFSSTSLDVRDADPEYRYRDGQYVIRSRLAAGELLTYVPGTYRDTTLSVDFRLAGLTRGRYVVLGCRTSVRNARSGYYAFRVGPDRYLLERMDDDNKVSTPLGLPITDFPTYAWGLTDLIRGEGLSRNRAELTCVGSTITARINGVQVARAVDGAYSAGRLTFGAGRTFGVDTQRANLSWEAWFDNLIVIGHDDVANATPFPGPRNGSDARDPLRLGGVDLASYCGQKGWGAPHVRLPGGAFSWACVDTRGTQRDIDMVEACTLQYRTAARAEYGRVEDENSWYCVKPGE